MPPTSRLKFHVQPRSSKTDVVGMHGDSIRVRLTAPPVDNSANDALVSLVAARLGIARRSVRVVAGAASRRKVIEIDGFSADAARTMLLATGGKIRGKG